ncbi:MAG: hypothetical protein AVDCRST_MAG66-1345, partial [uncultured Pseudonocardia sp.]
GGHPGRRAGRRAGWCAVRLRRAGPPRGPAADRD